VDAQGQNDLLERVRELEDRLSLRTDDTTHERSIHVSTVEGRKWRDPTPSFPRAFFLDNELFTPLPNMSLTPKIPIPPGILQHIGPHPSDICNCYLAKTHMWFPIFSPKRLRHQTLQFAEQRDDAAMALLLASMKLISSPIGDPATQELSVLYALVTDFYNSLEAAPAVSLCLLQAVILIAIFEIGHGIFPAAYFTIGRAARLSSFIAFSDKRDSTQLFQAADTWTMREEERRSWWAVFILER
jgi:hypothetical protein